MEGTDDLDRVHSEVPLKKKIRAYKIYSIYSKTYSIYYILLVLM